MLVLVCTRSFIRFVSLGCEGAVWGPWAAERAPSGGGNPAVCALHTGGTKQLFRGTSRWGTRCLCLRLGQELETEPRPLKFAPDKRFTSMWSQKQVVFLTVLLFFYFDFKLSVGAKDLRGNQDRERESPSSPFSDPQVRQRWIDVNLVACCELFFWSVLVELGCNILQDLSFNLDRWDPSSWFRELLWN